MRNWKLHKVGELKLDRVLLKEFYKDYQTLFGMPCTGCESKMEFYLQQLKNRKPMTESKTCVMKAGILVYVRARGQHYSADTITDEIALELLESNPKHANKFVVLPTEVEEQNNQEDAPKGARELVKDIKAAESIDDVIELAEGDERPSVVSAAAARIEELA